MPRRPTVPLEKVESDCLQGSHRKFHVHLIDIQYALSVWTTVVTQITKERRNNPMDEAVGLESESIDETEGPDTDGPGGPDTKQEGEHEGNF
jgi:hypothetical protein